MVANALQEAVAFYQLNDYLQPYQCEVVVEQMERLEARNRATQAKYEEAANTCADYEQEIERLQALVESCSSRNAADFDRIAELEKTRQAHVDEIIEYKADNERLREALVTVEMVADCTKDTWEGVCAHCTAFAALEDKT